MLTNFDIICMHTKILAEKMLESRDNLMSEELYAQYCISFEQLMQIVENEPGTLSEDKLTDMLLTVKDLETAFVAEQERLQDSISEERLKMRVKNVYSSTKIFNISGFNKTS